MQLQEKKLKIKGWSDEEIAHARKILLLAEQKRHPKKIAIEKTIFWIMLLIIICATIIGALIIEPLLLITTQQQALLVVLIIGLLSGSITTMLYRDIAQLKLHHHVASFLIIPLTAITTAIIITYQALAIAKELNITFMHNPLLLGSTYAFFGLLPYILFIYAQRKKHATY